MLSPVCPQPLAQRMLSQWHHHDCLSLASAQSQATLAGPRLCPLSRESLPLLSEPSQPLFPGLACCLSPPQPCSLSSTSQLAPLRAPACWTVGSRAPHSPAILDSLSSLVFQRVKATGLQNRSLILTPVFQAPGMWPRPPPHSYFSPKEFLPGSLTFPGTHLGLPRERTRLGCGLV